MNVFGMAQEATTSLLTKAQATVAPVIKPITTSNNNLAYNSVPETKAVIQPPTSVKQTSIDNLFPLVNTPITPTTNTNVDTIFGNTITPPSFNNSNFLMAPNNTSLNITPLNSVTPNVSPMSNVSSVSTTAPNNAFNFLTPNIPTTTSTNFNNIPSNILILPTVNTTTNIPATNNIPSNFFINPATSQTNTTTNTTTSNLLNSTTTTPTNNYFNTTNTISPSNFLIPPTVPTTTNIPATNNIPSNFFINPTPQSNTVTPNVFMNTTQGSYDSFFNPRG